MPLTSWRFDAILFDFDGTLADTREDVWAALDFAARQVGGGLPAFVRANPANLALPMRQLFAGLQPRPDESQFEIFTRQTARHYRSISTLPHTQLYPGIQALLQSLGQSGVPCYIVSLKEHSALARILALKGWGQYFTGHYSPDSFTGKVYTKSQLIGRLLGRINASAPVYVGDSATDVLAARENNIPCIGVTYGDGNTRELLATQPNYIAHAATELPLLMKTPTREEECHAGF